MNRLFEILIILLEKEKVTAKYLAEHFEVSQRTIMRDLDKLLVAGIPVQTQVGFEGGITIDKSYQIDSDLMTIDERQSILDGLKAIDSVSTSPVLPSFINKLLSQDVPSKYNEIIDINLSSWYGTELIAKIDCIRNAILEDKKITFLYHTGKGTSEKKVSPVKIVFRWSSWYLIGICDERDDFRTYKLNRMDQLQITEEVAVVREYHHKEHYFETVNYELVAVFDKEVRHRLIDDYGINSFDEQEDGLYFKRGFTTKDYMMTWILGFGDKIEVLEPLEIREEIKNIANNMKNLYEYDR